MSRRDLPGASWDVEVTRVDTGQRSARAGPPGMLEQLTRSPVPGCRQAKQKERVA